MATAKKLLFILLISCTLVLGVNLAANYQYYAAGNDWRYSVFFSLGVTILGVTGGTLLFQLLFRHFNWLKRPTLKLVLGVLIFAVFGLALMWVAILLSTGLLHYQYAATAQDYVSNSIYSVLFSMVIGLIVSGRSFLVNLKKAAEENAQMQQAMIQSQYETLKNQVNPHFLFNSLNTLTVMIPTQPDAAIKFVEQMAKVFRYSLQHNDEQTVALGTELKVVRSYLFLNEQRFNGKLKVDITVDDSALQRKIITQSLLMLTENAIKHNELSSEHPLSIRIYCEGAYLVVENTLQRKTIPEHSTRVGLDNIKKRYALVTATPAEVRENNNLFTVKIPLLV